LTLPPYLSPLRYPGGKGALAPFIGRLVSQQPRRPTTYAEPFAGGAGAALKLLVDEYVDRVILNDLDAGIAAFWRSVLGAPDALVQRIRTCKLNIAEWRRQRAVYTTPHAATDLELGFATFYLNRTNRSGILTGRPIGGLKQQGKWTIDARFNRQDLAARIQLIARYRNRIEIKERDGVEFLVDHLKTSDSCLYYVDPPYLSHGADLYLNTLSWENHQHLSRILSDASAPWVVTYDLDSRVSDELYPRHRVARFRIAHTAAAQHVGEEYAIFSNFLNLDSLTGLGTGAEFTITPQIASLKLSRTPNRKQMLEASPASRSRSQ
jgi:DNA adenine methylase